MKTILVWAALLLSLAAQPGETSSSSSWQRALFNRNSRNLWRRSGGNSELSGGYGQYDVLSDTLHNGYGNENNAFFDPYAVEQQPPLQEHSEAVYGIVEPLIEDTPCADRACLANDDCCPTGVCVNTYGEGKCIYVYGRQRDLCQRNADCAVGSVCSLDAEAAIWRCQAATAASTSLLQNVLGLGLGLGLRQPLGGECSSSSECQVSKGMCCQRLHQRAAPKLSCAYFQDPFDCVDIGQLKAQAAGGGASEYANIVFRQHRN